MLAAKYPADIDTAMLAYCVFELGYNREAAATIMRLKISPLIVSPVAFIYDKPEIVNAVRHVASDPELWRLIRASILAVLNIPTPQLRYHSNLLDRQFIETATDLGINCARLSEVADTTESSPAGPPPPPDRPTQTATQPHVPAPAAKSAARPFVPTVTRLTDLAAQRYVPTAAHPPPAAARPRALAPVVPTAARPSLAAARPHVPKPVRPTPAAAQSHAPASSAPAAAQPHVPASSAPAAAQPHVPASSAPAAAQPHVPTPVAPAEARPSPAAAQSHVPAPTAPAPSALAACPTPAVAQSHVPASDASADASPSPAAQSHVPAPAAPAEAHPSPAAAQPHVPSSALLPACATSAVEQTPASDISKVSSTSLSLPEAVKARVRTPSARSAAAAQAMSSAPARSEALPSAAPRPCIYTDASTNITIFVQLDVEYHRTRADVYGSSTSNPTEPMCHFHKCNNEWPYARLIWHVSVPVYSLYRWKTFCCDQHLVDMGNLAKQSAVFCHSCGVMESVEYHPLPRRPTSVPLCSNCVEKPYVMRQLDVVYRRSSSKGVPVASRSGRPPGRPRKRPVSPTSSPSRSSNVALTPAPKKTWPPMRDPETEPDGRFGPPLNSILARIVSQMPPSADESDNASAVVLDLDSEDESIDRGDDIHIDSDSDDDFFL